MTYGEFALLRVLREASSIAHLPIEIIKTIIRQVNLRARVAYDRRSRLNEANVWQEQYNSIWRVQQPSGITLSRRFALALQRRLDDGYALPYTMRARVRQKYSRRGPGF